ncbi:hypothetical protein L2D08_11855 [Domibacillus sp. PGB-M46]|uniref:hypothetical protein n=1 Tax=Domibacillus sp. PGB-M46 TaxID=2910255 RepID=UPI001F59867C|nr:hypothetical protein [Domibacillus sp. PGB-M46]MCI2255060.1 hypothetical protein [Domibacillus sp. PGB-M46]
MDQAATERIYGRTSNDLDGQLSGQKSDSERNFLLEKLGKQIKAFMNFIDSVVSLAADISWELNLAGLSVKTLFNTEDKTRFRGLLKENQASSFYTVYSY